MYSSGGFALPPLIIDGGPKSLPNMIQKDFVLYIPKMIRSALGLPQTSVLRFKDYAAPAWWPREVEWSNKWLQSMPSSSDGGKLYLRRIINSCFSYFKQEDILHLFDTTCGDQLRWKLVEGSNNTWFLMDSVTNKTIWEFSSAYQVIPLLALKAKHESYSGGKFGNSTDDAPPSQRTRSGAVDKQVSPPEEKSSHAGGFLNRNYDSKKTKSLMSGIALVKEWGDDLMSPTLDIKYEEDLQCPSCGIPLSDYDDAIRHETRCSAITREQEQRLEQLISVGLIPARVHADATAQVAHRAANRQVKTSISFLPPPKPTYPPSADAPVTSGGTITTSAGSHIAASTTNKPGTDQEPVGSKTPSGTGSCPTSPITNIPSSPLKRMSLARSAWRRSRSGGDTTSNSDSQAAGVTSSCGVLGNTILQQTYDKRKKTDTDDIGDQIKLSPITLKALPTEPSVDSINDMDTGDQSIVSQAGRYFGPIPFSSRLGRIIHNNQYVNQGLNKGTTGTPSYCKYRFLKRVKLPYEEFCGSNPCTSTTTTATETSSKGSTSSGKANSTSTTSKLLLAIKALEPSGAGNQKLEPGSSVKQDVAAVPQPTKSVRETAQNTTAIPRFFPYVYRPIRLHRYDRRVILSNNDRHTSFCVLQNEAWPHRERRAFMSMCKAVKIEVPRLSPETVSQIQQPTNSSVSSGNVDAPVVYKPMGYQRLLKCTTPFGTGAGFFGQQKGVSFQSHRHGISRKTTNALKKLVAKQHKIHNRRQQLFAVPRPLPTLQSSEVSKNLKPCPRSIKLIKSSNGGADEDVSYTIEQTIRDSPTPPKHSNIPKTVISTCNLGTKTPDSYNATGNIGTSIGPTLNIGNNPNPALRTRSSRIIKPSQRWKNFSTSSEGHGLLGGNSRKRFMNDTKPSPVKTERSSTTAGGSLNTSEPGPSTSAMTQHGKSFTSTKRSRLSCDLAANIDPRLLAPNLITVGKGHKINKRRPALVTSASLLPMAQAAQQGVSSNMAFINSIPRTLGNKRLIESLEALMASTSQQQSNSNTSPTRKTSPLRPSAVDGTALCDPKLEPEEVSDDCMNDDEEEDEEQEIGHPNSQESMVIVGKGRTTRLNSPKTAGSSTMTNLKKSPGDPAAAGFESKDPLLSPTNSFLSQPLSIDTAEGLNSVFGTSANGTEMYTDIVTVRRGRPGGGKRKYLAGPKSKTAHLNRHVHMSSNLRHDSDDGTETNPESGTGILRSPRSPSAGVSSRKRKSSVSPASNSGLRPSTCSPYRDRMNNQRSVLLEKSSILQSKLSDDFIVTRQCRDKEIIMTFTVAERKPQLEPMYIVGSSETVINPKTKSNRKHRKRNDRVRRPKNPDEAPPVKKKKKVEPQSLSQQRPVSAVQQPVDSTIVDSSVTSNSSKPRRRRKLTSKVFPAHDAEFAKPQTSKRKTTKAAENAIIKSQPSRPAPKSVKLRRAELAKNNVPPAAPPSIQEPDSLNTTALSDELFPVAPVAKTAPTGPALPNKHLAVASTPRKSPRSPSPQRKPAAINAIPVSFSSATAAFGDSMSDTLKTHTHSEPVVTRSTFPRINRISLSAIPKGGPPIASSPKKDPTKVDGSSSQEATTSGGSMTSSQSTDGRGSSASSGNSPKKENNVMDSGDTRRSTRSSAAVSAGQPPPAVSPPQAAIGNFDELMGEHLKMKQMDHSKPSANNIAPTLQQVQFGVSTRQRAATPVSGASTAQRSPRFGSGSSIGGRMSNNDMESVPPDPQMIARNPQGFQNYLFVPTTVVIDQRTSQNNSASRTGFYVQGYSTLHPHIYNSLVGPGTSTCSSGVWKIYNRVSSELAPAASTSARLPRLDQSLQDLDHFSNIVFKCHICNSHNQLSNRFWASISEHLRVFHSDVTPVFVQTVRSTSQEPGSSVESTDASAADHQQHRLRQRVTSGGTSRTANSNNTSVSDDSGLIECYNSAFVSLVATDLQ